jgi:putative ABC transport system permease protein
MLKNYLNMAFRHGTKHKLFTSINVFGLALSLSFCMLIIAILHDQNSFDTFHPRSDDVYRVLTSAHRKDGDTEHYASTPFPLGKVLEAEHPAVERVVQVARGLSTEARLGALRISVNGFFTDGAFFDVFGFTLAQGDPSTALDKPSSIVLSDETAQKIFGSTDAIGKSISFGNFGEFIVTGVLTPKRHKSHLEFDALASLSTLPALERGGDAEPILTNWNNYYRTYTYVRLKSGHTAEELEAFLESVPARFYGDLELESRDRGYSFSLQRLDEITPGRLLSQSIGRGFPEIALYFLGALALVGMAAALFNYTNLTLARSLTRAKEVGLRKTVGASRGQLFAQMITESVLTALAALVLAIAILEIVLIPAFRSLEIVQAADLTLSFNPTIGVWFAVFTIIVGIVAGLLPAGVISSFRPAVVLKDISRVKVYSGLTLRKMLLVVQFVLSLVLLILLTAMDRQVRHALTMDYGFDWHRKISIELQGQDAVRLASQLAQHPNVERMTALSHHPISSEDGASDVRIRSSDERVPVRDYSVDANFVDVFRLKLVAGRNFDGTVSDHRAVLINERFAERFMLGTPQQAVGRSLILGDSVEVQIAGVLKDFLFKPATYELEPLLLRSNPETWRALVAELRSGDVRETLRYFEQVWKKNDPFRAVQARRYEDIVDDAYTIVNGVAVVVTYLAAIAFTVSMLGLFGIVIYQVESRTKEIGIRKVLGAGTRNLIFQLARGEFIVLLVAAILAVPLALLITSEFLAVFPYRIDTGIGVVLPALIIVFGFAGTTVFWQTLRATRANPVKALKYE